MFPLKSCTPLCLSGFLFSKVTGILHFPLLVEGEDELLDQVRGGGRNCRHRLRYGIVFHQVMAITGSSSDPWALDFSALLLLSSIGPFSSIADCSGFTKQQKVVNKENLQVFVAVTSGIVTPQKSDTSTVADAH